jgi:hypothetical protein
MHQRLLQNRRHEIDHQRSEVHEKILGDIKVSVYKSEEIVLHLKDQSMIGIHETQQAITEDGDGCKDLELVCQSSTQSRSLSKRSGRKAMKGKRGDVTFHIRLPWWLAPGNRCLDIYMRKNLFEGSIGCRAYRVVSRDAPIIDYVRKGNMTGIQEMFRTGAASPNDRDIHGRTLLGVSPVYKYTFEAELT